MNLSKSFNKMFRLLSFRISREELLNLNKIDLYLGLVITWVVGMGRYWDDPGAKLLQHLGVGSLIYVFLLSFFLWVLFKPFKIQTWNYSNLLTFVSLTSFPAILYAIPVERFLSINLSAEINAYFLLTVAVWRVALLFFFFVRYAKISKFETIVATLLPLTAIVSTLTVLNLERAVFNIMGGDISENTSSDTAYVILMLLTVISIILVIPLIISYIVILYKNKDQSIT